MRLASLLLLCCAFVQAQTLNNKTARRSYQEGLKHEESNQLPDALLAYTDAITADSGFADAYLHRGKVRIALGDYKQALDDLNSALRLDPRNAEAYRIRGDTNRKATQYQKALEDYNQAATLK